jgi:hypothetical protein
MKNKTYFWFYVAKFLLEWEMFQTNDVEKIKIHILCSITLFRKLYRLWDKAEKHCTAGQVTDDNTTHLHWMLDN